MGHVFETQCIMSVQGHPRSLILAPIQSASSSSNRNRSWSYLAPFQRWGLLELLYTESHFLYPVTHPYSGQNFGGFRDVGMRSKRRSKQAPQANCGRQSVKARSHSALRERRYAPLAARSAATCLFICGWTRGDGRNHSRPLPKSSQVPSVTALCVNAPLEWPMVNSVASAAKWCCLLDCSAWINIANNDIIQSVKQQIVLCLGYVVSLETLRCRHLILA